MKTTKCAHPLCHKEGTFPAPRDPRHIDARQYFCKEHIKEFNKNWNGLHGMTEDEIFAMQQKATWDRPTWKMGTQSDSFIKSQFEFKNAEELHRFFVNRQHESFKRKSEHTENIKNTLPADVIEACSIFEIEWPESLENIKKKYLSLIKKHHPDVNKSSKEAEENVKKINVAFQILKNYAQ